MARVIGTGGVNEDSGGSQEDPGGQIDDVKRLSSDDSRCSSSGLLLGGSSPGSAGRPRMTDTTDGGKHDVSLEEGTKEDDDFEGAKETDEGEYKGSILLV